MWYVIQVPTGREQQILEECKSYEVEEFAEEFFIPRFEQKQKFLGAWHTEQKLLFPGYLFVISTQPEELYRALKRIPRLTRVLGVGEKWTAMTEEDIAIVTRLTAGIAEAAKTQKEWLVKLSEGKIQGDKVTVIKGPLKGLEGKISRIDRHKRLAWLTMELFGRTVEIRAGLEIVRRE